MNAPIINRRSASTVPKTWRLRIATADTIPLVVSPFQTFNNKTRVWTTHSAGEFGSFLGRVVAIFI